MTTQLTNERKFDLLSKYGLTDEEMRDNLAESGFKDLDNEIVMCECARNMGYIWSFKLSRWLAKNRMFLDDDQEDYDALLDEVRKEEHNA